MVSDYFSGFFGSDALVQVVAWFDDDCWTDRASAYAACSGNFAFFFDSEFFHCVFERFQNFEGAKGDAAA